MHNKIKLARDASWDVRVLWTLNISWDVIADALESGDYEGIRSVLDEIRDLREDQKKCERELLTDTQKKDCVAIALKLIALYHWLKATELTAQLILGEKEHETDRINYHFDRAIDASKDAGDVDLTNALRMISVGAKLIADVTEMS